MSEIWSSEMSLDWTSKEYLIAGVVPSEVMSSLFPHVRIGETAVWVQPHGLMTKSVKRGTDRESIVTRYEKQMRKVLEDPSHAARKPSDNGVHVNVLREVEPATRSDEVSWFLLLAFNLPSTGRTKAILRTMYLVKPGWVNQKRKSGELHWQRPT